MEDGSSTAALTPMQAGMLFNGLLRPGVEIQQVVVRPPGFWREDELAQAFAFAADRHDILRTTFDVSAEVPRQRVQATLPGLARHRGQGPLDDVLFRFLEADRLEPLDLEGGPVFRLTFVHGADGIALVWTFHHAHLDGRSMEIVLRDVLLRYQRGAEHAPDALGGRFADHVAGIAAQAGPAMDGYFDALLEDLGEPTPLPGPTPPSDAARGMAEARHRIPADLVAKLVALGEAESFTLNNAVQAAWALLLARYGYSDDIVFGATRACRHVTPQSKEVAGCLINTVPVRARLSMLEDLGGLLQELRRQALAVRPFESADLSRVNERAPVASGARLFDSVVVFEGRTFEATMRAIAPAFAQWRFELRGRSDAPLTLALYLDEDDALECLVEHDRGRISPYVAETLGPRLERVLSAIVASRRTRFSELQLELPADAVADTLDPEPTRPAYPTLFQQAVPAHSHRVAVVEAGSGMQFTYSELAGRVGAVAQLLVEEGVGPGDVVAVAAHRSAGLVVAALAAFRVGAVYLPVDPAYPKQRLDYLIADSGAKVVLAARGVSTEAFGLPVVDADADELRNVPLPHSPASGDPAYLIYTSGSTGKPKGVSVLHGNLAAHAWAATRTYGLDHTDRVLQFASPSFDISIEEIFPALTVGASIVLRAPAMAESMAKLLDAVRSRGVTVLQLPTAFFNELALHLEVSGDRLPESVRLVVLGGERASAAALRTFRAVEPAVRLINAYGPTEVTVTATAFDIPEDVPEDVPIGEPFGACTARVVDRALATVPPGGLGELLLGGPQVAHGYHQRPELTEERFIDVPELGRSYRTGDLVRRLPSGDLLFVGRVDGQVKIRGFRIELGEVEAALEADAEVAEAVAAAVPVVGGAEFALVAEVVPGSASLDLEALMVRLRERVPGPMIPARIVARETLRKTTAGKVDRRALAQHPLTLVDDGDVEAARDELERTLLAAYEEVLAVQGLGVLNDFVASGGHSLRAVRLAAKLERELGRRVTVGDVIAHPTVRALAEHLGRSDGACDTLVQLNERVGDHQPVYCVCGLHVYAPLANFVRERPVFGVFVPEEEQAFGDDGFLRTEELASAYLRAIQQEHGRRPLILVGVSYGAIVALEMAKQLEAEGAAPDTLLMVDPLLPEMLEKRPLDTVVNLLLRTRNKPFEMPARIARRLKVALGVKRAATGFAEAPDNTEWMARERAYARALVDYVPRLAPYGGAATIVVARDRDPAAVDRVVDGWRRWLVGPLGVRVVPGDHGNILESPNVIEVAGVLTPELRNRASLVFPAVI